MTADKLTTTKATTAKATGGRGRTRKKAGEQHGRRPDWGDGFLSALATTGNVLASCQTVGIGRSTAYDRYARDEGFAARWRAAMDDAADVLEAEALRRATRGVDEPVFYKGERVGTVRKYSDTLLIFLLKGARPEKFRDRYEVRHLTESDLDAEIARLEHELADRGGEVPTE